MREERTFLRDERTFVREERTFVRDEGMSRESRPLGPPYITESQHEVFLMDRCSNAWSISLSCPLRIQSLKFRGED